MKKSVSEPLGDGGEDEGVNDVEEREESEEAENSNDEGSVVGRREGRRCGVVSGEGFLVGEERKTRVVLGAAEVAAAFV